MSTMQKEVLLPLTIGWLLISTLAFLSGHLEPLIGGGFALAVGWWVLSD